MKAPHDDDHWLSRPATLRGLWIGFAVVLALTVLGELAIGIKGYFTIDGWMGFAAVFGFGACVAMVVVAKALGVLLKRRDDYYHD
jgi:protein-S-isoprenylcysteine O-methyltransferase Ste14